MSYDVEQLEELQRALGIQPDPKELEAKLRAEEDLKMQFAKTRSVTDSLAAFVDRVNNPPLTKETLLAQFAGDPTTQQALDLLMDVNATDTERLISAVESEIHLKGCCSTDQIAGMAEALCSEKPHIPTNLYPHQESAIARMLEAGASERLMAIPIEKADFNKKQEDGDCEFDHLDFEGIKTRRTHHFPILDGPHMGQILDMSDSLVDRIFNLPLSAGKTNMLHNLNCMMIDEAHIPTRHQLCKDIPWTVLASLQHKELHQFRSLEFATPEVRRLHLVRNIRQAMGTLISHHELIKDNELFSDAAEQASERNLMVDKLCDLKTDEDIHRFGTVVEHQLDEEDPTRKQLKDVWQNQRDIDIQRRSLDNKRKSATKRNNRTKNKAARKARKR